MKAWMLVLHPYTPGVRPKDQARCWEALAVIRLAVETKMLDWPCEEDNSYAIGLQVAVDSDKRVVIVEHDIMPTPEQVYEMAECPQVFCAMDYLLPGGSYWTEVSDQACLGLSKIKQEAWDRSPAWPRVPLCHWRDLAGRVSERIGPAHIHPGPVVHRHH